MKLTPENYHCQEANQAYMSVSQYKQFRSCEARALAEIRGEYVRPVSTAMMVGSYIDAYFTEDLDRFIEDHPEIISTRGATKGQLKSDFKQAEEIIN
ncbi:MAG TPA: PD-(D/E)XK nuclease-like domain-containing protein, partial [Clostridia bacterium]|nr:PD-(D/E)XK nuclease-like domain-containing protein [Clostridia bacterium]